MKVSLRRTQTRTLLSSWENFDWIESEHRVYLFIEIRSSKLTRFNMCANDIYEGLLLFK